MREALARSNLDFSTSEPSKGRRIDVASLPRILRLASISTAALVGGVIVLNALFLQDRKHPAPLLRAPDPAPVPTVASVSPPQHAPRLAAAVSPQAPAVTLKGASRDPIADELNRGSAAASERKAAKPTAAASDGARGDAIAGLIGASAPQPSASVLSAQKALLRLGYVVKADGVFGATTRQAIERFEKDNKLPIRGELTAKLSRDLIAKTGR